jgi:hypothetical protein
VPGAKQASAKPSAAEHACISAVYCPDWQGRRWSTVAVDGCPAASLNWREGPLVRAAGEAVTGYLPDLPR